MGGAAKTVGGVVSNPIGSVGSLVGGAVAGAPGVGNDLSQFWKQIGGGLANANPVPHNNYHADTPTLNTVDFAKAINPLLGQVPGNYSAADQSAGAQNAFVQALMGRGNTAYGQEQQLLGQLQQDAAGNGPGTALAKNMINEATQNNIAQNTGMIASQKGINPALAARLAGQNAARANQDAAAQGTNMALAQQLQARQQLGGMVGNDLNLNTGAAGTLLSQGRQQDIQQATDAGTLQNNYLSTLVGGNSNQNNAINTGALGTQQINSGVSQSNTDAAGKVEGGIINGIGGAAAAALGGKGGTPAAAHGGKIPGKASVAGDSPKNDTVPIMASPGEIVIPRSVADDPEKAKRFVEAIQAKKGKGKPSTASHFQKLQAIKKQLAELEQQMGGSAA